MKFFKLPDLGEGLQEAEIVEWHVAVGDAVEVDQIIVALETAKAIVEVPSPQSGTVANVFGKPGDIIHIGEPLLEFAESGEADSGTVVGELNTSRDSTAADNFVIGAIPGSPRSPPASRATPAVRALALRLNVDLDALTGSGSDGLITALDVESASRLNRVHGDAETLRGTRRTMANAMSRSHAEVAAVTLCEDADLHLWPGDSDTTIRLCRAIAKACEAAPELNAWYDGSSLSRRRLSNVDIGIAVDTAEGLFEIGRAHV